MDVDEEEIEIVVSSEKHVDSVALGKTLWTEITGGVGIWEPFRPIIAVALSLVPFLFLGQHFNRNHQRGIDFLLFTNTPSVYTHSLGSTVFLVDFRRMARSQHTSIGKSSPELIFSFNSPLAIPSKSDLSALSNSSGISPEMKLPTSLELIAQYITESSLLE